jgi:hypothetical protein
MVARGPLVQARTGISDRHGLPGERRELEVRAPRPEASRHAPARRCGG